MPTDTFAGKDAKTTCPNCGSPLFSGLAEGNVLVCQNGEGEGCAMAVDPDHLEGESAITARGVWDVEPEPEVGPPNNPETVPAPPPDPYLHADDPWRPPTSAPQAANAGEEESPQETPPAPEPTPEPEQPTEPS